ncbi:MAG TPA: VWA domain-containing protein [Propionibacteriaceae bacterium]|nr:VWA domain-containing protein [Propionibacteriaceae bacterium]
MVWTPLLGLPEFMNPGRLIVLLVLPLLVVLYVVLLRLKRNVGIRFTNTGILGAILPKQSRWRRHVAVAMSLCSLIALSLAWARPLGVDKVPRERATIVVVVDVSMSMTAVDVKPNRLDAAKASAREFVKSLPSKYNVSVVSLSASPSVLLPPSTDRFAADRALSTLEPEDGTALGDSIGVALDAVGQAPKGDDGTVAPGLIVLLSDGQSTTGQSPLQMAGEAKDKSVPVYTIAYGTDTGYVDIDGTRERVPPDAATLESIAAATGAKTFDAESASELNNVYETIGSEVGYEEVRREITARWAMYALAFAVVAALGAVSMAARWP